MYAQEIEREIHERVIKLLRELTQLLGGAMSEMLKTARHNDEIKNWHYFMNKLEMAYDFSSGTPVPRTEGENKLPFNISYYRPDYSPETIRELDKMGIPHLTFSNGEHNFIITDNDPKTIEMINYIRFGQVKGFKDVTVSAKMSSDDFMERFPASSCVSVTGFSPSQVEYFNKFARENRFFFTAVNKEDGWTLYIPKESLTPETKTVLSQIAVNNRAGIDSLYVDLSSFDKTVKKAKSMNEIFKSKGKNIYIDRNDPCHYVVADKNSAFITRNGVTTEIKRDENDSGVFYRKLNAELAMMTDQQTISYDEFVTKYKEDISSPLARALYLRDGTVSCTERNKAIVSSIFNSVEKRYSSINPRNVFINDIKKRIEEVYKLNAKILKSKNCVFVDVVKKNTAEAKLLMSILESGDYSSVANSSLITPVEKEMLLSDGKMGFEDFKAAYILNQIQLEAGSNPEYKDMPELNQEQVKEYLAGKENGDIDKIFADAVEPFVVQEIREVTAFKEILNKEKITPDVLSDGVRDKIITDIEGKSDFSAFIIEDTLNEMKELYNGFHIDEQIASFSEMKENTEIEFSNIIDPREEADKRDDNKGEER